MPNDDPPSPQDLPEHLINRIQAGEGRAELMLIRLFTSGVRSLLSNEGYENDIEMITATILKDAVSAIRARRLNSTIELTAFLLGAVAVLNPNVSSVWRHMEGNESKEDQFLRIAISKLPRADRRALDQFFIRMEGPTRTYLFSRTPGFEILN